MPEYRIPFNRPCFQGSEQAYMADAIRRGHISGDGHFTKLCHGVLEAETRALKALLTPSCTHALEMAALLLDIVPGDKVIVPSFTFVSTVNAFALRGAIPVFADIRPDTLNLDENLLPGLLDERVRAVIAVHYAGVGCEMDAILVEAGRCGIPVVEDNAHGLFGTYRGKPLGCFGALAALSFHETKNITCGEGGALLINNGSYLDRADVIRDKGTNRKRFFQGEVDKYTWVGLGSSFLPSDLQAAFLYAQIEARASIQERRQAIWNRYAQGLRAWSKKVGAHLPYIPPHCGQSYHMFYVVLPSLGHRRSLIAHLQHKGIMAVFHYQPLHLSDMGLRFGGRKGDCPVVENISDRILRLPFFNTLTEAEQDEVMDAMYAWADDAC